MGSYIPNFFELYLTYADENFDSLKTTGEYIMGYGYNFQEHKVLTKDGYILTLFRIPGKLHEEIRPKPPVLLMHGLCDSGFTYFINGNPEKCLPFLLSDEGYDVWVGNNRGNNYSTEHVKKAEYNYLDFSSKFWDFSLDEMALFDLPAMIEYILNNSIYKPKKITYIGHSQGTCQFFILGCTNPQYLNDRIKCFIGLAPVIFVSNIQSQILRIAAFLHLPDLAESIGIRNILVMPYINSLKALAVRFMPKIPLWIVQILLGKTKTQNLNFKRLVMIGKEMPGGTSTKNLIHWCQLIRGGKLRKFDYGKEENLSKYYQVHCPEYNLSNLQKLSFEKMYAVGDSDVLVTSKDLIKLSNVISFDHQIQIEDYGHNDPLWADTAYLKVYSHILEWIQYKESKEALKDQNSDDTEKLDDNEDNTYN